jgi:2-polyprenyl-6-methoxyphenol hydroxylase-like FAD-dependent oxidoreductase
VLLIGDAAHSITPHLGQAGAQDLEDALVLGRLVSEGMAIDSLTTEFMAHRFERCRITYETSLQLARWELHPDAQADIPGTALLQARAVAEPA